MAVIRRKSGLNACFGGFSHHQPLLMGKTNTYNKNGASRNEEGGLRAQLISMGFHAKVTRSFGFIARGRNVCYAWRGVRSFGTWRASWKADFESKTIDADHHAAWDNLSFVVTNLELNSTQWNQKRANQHVKLKISCVILKCGRLTVRDLVS